MLFPFSVKAGYKKEFLLYHTCIRYSNMRYGSCPIKAGNTKKHKPVVSLCIVCLFFMRKVKKDSKDWWYDLSILFK